MTRPLRSFQDYRDAYARGATAAQILAQLDEAEQAQGDQAVWIHRLAPAERAKWATPSGGPLAGLPFAIKDNLDLAGTRTTAACPSFNPTRSAASAHVVEKMIQAGAIPLGKTNLDQFATGLVGVRSPYGTPKNPHNPAFIPGGSSSGSAVAVAAGLAAFSLATDTAGSGRVPASLNGIFGYKPTRGLLSTRGVVPACRTLDCVSVFARNLEDTAAVARVAIDYDPLDPLSRICPPTTHLAPQKPRIGVPEHLEFFGDSEAAALFAKAVARFRETGAEVITFDDAPFRAVARLLYEGPWVAERYLAVGSHIESGADGVHPVTKSIILGGAKLTASSTFKAIERLAELRRQCDSVLGALDAILTPTLPTPYTCEQVAADPVRLNSNLGTYTNHFNLLDLCGLAIPAGVLHGRVPWGVTLSASAFRDDVLFDLAARFGGVSTPAPVLNASGPRISIAVCGAHLRGLPLNHELVRLGAHFIRETKTAPNYRLYSLPNTQPAKPGLVRVASGGGSIVVEIWDMPLENAGRFLAGIPSPLGLGTLLLDDGVQVKGFLCEAAAVAGALDVTHLGGWRAFVSPHAK